MTRVAEKKAGPEAFYSSDAATLYHGDVVDILSKLPPSSIDTIFADPPYNLSNDGTTCHAGKRVSVNKGEWDRSSGSEQDFEFHKTWIAACRRVLAPHGTIWISGTYHSIYTCGYILQSEGWHLLNDVTWFKPNAAPNLGCRMFTASHETLLWARKDKKAKHTFNYDFVKHAEWPGDFLKKPDKQMRSVWAIGSPAAAEKRFGKHPTQKPLALLERILLAASNPDDVVLDPFCGSGTTGVAAIKHGRRFVGIDLAMQYLQDIAVPRLRDAEQSLLPLG